VSESSSPASPGETKGSAERDDSSVVAQFFLIPLAVVAGMVGIFLLFTMATRKTPTPEDQLKALRSGRFNQRWQAAFELSNLLKDPHALEKNPQLPAELVKVLDASMAAPEEDPRVCRYLVLALGNTGSPQSVPALLKAGRATDQETRLYALGGLARIRAAESAPLFIAGLSDPDPSVRSVCAFGLGGLEGLEAGPQLHDLLKDSVPEVQWNAALALARHEDDSGKDILAQLLDRKYLDQFQGLQSEDKAELILNALRGIKYLKISEFDKKIEKLAQEDPDIRVRKAAKSWKGSDNS